MQYFRSGFVVSKTNDKMKNKRLYRLLLLIPFLLSVPAIAMLFTDEVKWSFFDFVIAGFLLLTLVGALEFVLRVSSTNTGKWLAGIAVVLVFLLIWAELAVGIFGSPFAGS